MVTSDQVSSDHRWCFSLRWCHRGEWWFTMLEFTAVTQWWHRGDWWRRGVTIHRAVFSYSKPHYWAFRTSDCHTNIQSMPGAALGTLEMVPKLASRPDDAAALVLPDQSWSVTTFNFGFWTFMHIFCTFLVKTQPLIILQWSVIPQINSHAWLKLSLLDFFKKNFPSLKMI